MVINDYSNKKILCLASGGGKQAPLFSASGADVTVFDISEEQLKYDQKIAKEYNLSLKTIKGDMCDLSIFSSNEFDMVINPVSVTYIEDTNPVFKEVSRVLKPGGKFIFGAPNPLIYLFSEELESKGVLQVKYKIPYYGKDYIKKSDIEKGDSIENSHTLESLIGGITRNNMTIHGFIEDKGNYLIDNYINTYIMIYAIKK